jgi:nucleoside-diphosphate-sugar epimerase
VPLLLAKQYRVHVVDVFLHGGRSLLGVWSHPHFEFWRADIRERSVIRAALTNIDAVVHLAAIVGDPACARDPELARAVNLDASIQLLEESRRAKVSRFVFASTCSNYGRGEDSEKYLDETASLRPLSVYAETKVKFEQKLLESDPSADLCATSLRFATLFGVSPRMRFDLTVNEFTMELLTKKRLVVFGEQFCRPYVHVLDAARAIELVLSAEPEKVNNQVFNVGSTSQNYQKKQLVELISSYEPLAAIEYVRRDEDPRDYRVSFARIKEQLNFEPLYTVHDGVGELVQLIRSTAIRDYSDPVYYNIPMT